MKVTGAPLTGMKEHDVPQYDAQAADGTKIIPETSHIRNAAPENSGGIRMLRRGYSFTDGFDPVLGQLDAGLFFISYQRNPHLQFVPIQTRPSARRAPVPQQGKRTPPPKRWCGR